jgi:branched-chain amino acid transport system substrate-binding protein
MLRRTFIAASSVAAAMLTLGGAAMAQDTMKIGLILPMPGPLASTGR